MRSSGDPFPFRRLAIAFGEGLVFAVGMKLTEDAIRRRNTPVATGNAPDLASVADRLARIKERLKGIDRPAAKAGPSQMDQRTIVAIVRAVEKHLEAHALKVQKRIDDLEATVAATAERAAATRIEMETNALRERVLTIQREMLSSIPQIVASQVATQVEKKTAALEARLQQTVETAVEAAVAPLRTEVRDLRRHLSDTDDTMAEFVSAISDTVRRTAETPAPRSDGEWRPGPRVDLKTLRKRLSEIDRPVTEPRGPLPATAESRRGPVAVRQFPVAS